MTRSLQGRTLFITGASRGIGLAIACRAAADGANVVLVAKTTAPNPKLPGTLYSAAEAVEAAGGQALAVPTDIRDEAAVAAAVKAGVERFGGIDILVNNAGIYPMVPLADLDTATFRHVLDVNLTGLFLCTKLASARMIEQGRGGRIVNVTSIDALHPSMVGLSHYDASKHGAWGFTKNVALDLAPHGIWVNAVAPGGIKTPGTGEMDEANMRAFEAMIPMRRMGEPDDIGRAVLFLASELSSYMTGSQIVVDGGRLLA
jgi:2-deoxy-D-gluconate 3-dehydrogenase